VKRHRQTFEGADQIVEVATWLSKFETVHPARQSPHECMRLQPGDALPGAIVKSRTKRDVIARTAMHIEPVRILVMSLIEIGRGIEQEH